MCDHLHLLKPQSCEQISFSLHSVLPKSVDAFSKCLKKPINNTKNTMTASACRKRLREPCTTYGGISERRCFHKIHGWNVNYSDYTVQEGQELQNGSFSGFDKDVVNYKTCLRGVKKVTDACLPKLVDTCKNKSIIATKVIRLRVQTVKYLLERNPFVKIIHYIRDPRGVLESRTHSEHGRFKIERTKMNFLVNNAINLCRKIHHDTEEYRQLAWLYPNNFLSLRYEDLVANVTQKLQDIYTFINAELPVAVTSFFKKSLSGKHDSGPMGTARKNGSATAVRWQTTLDREYIQIVNRICEEALRDVKYMI